MLRLCLRLSRFMIGSSDSDSDDDKRVVRSAKDRRFDELKGTCEELRVRLHSRAYLGCGVCPTPPGRPLRYMM